MGPTFWNGFFIVVGLVVLVTAILWIKHSLDNRHQADYDKVMITGKLVQQLCTQLQYGDRDGAIRLFRRKTLHGQAFAESYIDQLAERCKSGRL
ncbi:hypothetical protein ACLGL1_03730 [Peptococcus simiae]|uniref:hypothetical protein n=1 Tax=Peptococcus simiae TaxID=1643805 RepID=UPI003980EA92